MGVWLILDDSDGGDTSTSALIKAGACGVPQPVVASQPRAVPKPVQPGTLHKVGEVLPGVSLKL